MAGLLKMTPDSISASTRPGTLPSASPNVSHPNSASVYQAEKVITGLLSIIVFMASAMF